MFANILITTDGSEIAQKGVDHGLALAKALNAKATILTVTEALPVDYGGGHAGGWIPSQEEFDRFDAAQLAAASGILGRAERAAEEIGLSVEVVHFPNGHPAVAILAIAKEKGCDLIVMASHGRRGIKRLLLGSQTAEVVAQASIPVLVVR